MKKLILSSILLIMVFGGLFFIYFKHQNKSIVFVILANLRNDQDNMLWQRCYRSVREFYPHEKIVILDDNSKVNFPDLPLDVTYVKSEFPGAGELLPYYYFLQHHWADKMIFLHDSMLLSRPFQLHELDNPIKFHWYFENHAYDDNAAINYLLSHLKDAQELIHYNMNYKDQWYGCFGVTSIIDLKVLKKIERKYAFTESLKGVVHNRDHRMALERVFGIMLFKDQIVNISNCANFGSIFRHPYSASLQINDAKVEEIKRVYNSAIIKTWQSR